MNQQLQRPSKQKYIQQIRTNIPLNILNDNIWIAYYFKEQNGKFTKPPMSSKGYSVEEGAQGVSFQQACQDGYPGILITKSTPYVAFDIDDDLAKKGEREFSLAKLHPTFKEFLQKYPSYTELSPSGCGLRIIVKCENKEALFDLPGRLILDPDKCIGGELFVHSGYVTLTGNCIKNKGYLTTLRDVDILKWARIKQKVEETVNPATPIDTKLPKLSLVKEALDLCKLDQSDKIKEVYEHVFGHGYQHYDYWLRILAACKDYAARSGQEETMLELVDKWSQTDEVAYTGIEDLITHWDTLDPKEKGTTYKTLMKMARLLHFEWPVPAYDKKGNPTGGPAVNVPSNFKYLMNYLGIGIKQDAFTSQMYIDAPSNINTEHLISPKKKLLFDLVGPYDSDELKSALWKVAQANGYGPISFGSIKASADDYLWNYVEGMNLMERWLSTPYEELPHDMKEPGTDESISNVSYLLDCFSLAPGQNRELVGKFLNTFFFEMVMPIYGSNMEFAQRSFMLVITGPEATHKTTFFNMLFPAIFRDIFVLHLKEDLKSAKSKRDFGIATASCALAVVDEFEQFYCKEQEAFFKSVVTGDISNYVPIYKGAFEKQERMAALAATTNEDQFSFDIDGSRRMAFIKIDKPIDTNMMKGIRWHYFYNQFIKDGAAAVNRGEYPWKPSVEDIELQYELNEQYRAKTNLEYALHELFDFTAKPRDLYTIKNAQSDPFLLGVKDIKGLLLNYDPKIPASLAELKRKLPKICGKYTHTTNKRLDLPQCKGYIENGIVRSGQWTKYLMPPRKTDFTE